jgi:hypothetical protein
MGVVLYATFRGQGLTFYRVEDVKQIAEPNELTNEYAVYAIEYGPGPVKVVIYPDPKSLRTAAILQRFTLPGQTRASQFG